jgi:hypothetical protein
MGESLCIMEWAPHTNVTNPLRQNRSLSDNKFFQGLLQSIIDFWLSIHISSAFISLAYRGEDIVFRLILE